MLMPGRSFGSENYRFGFNGKENDIEVKGIGNSIDFGARIYDPRIGRFLSVDPYTEKYAMLSPYQFAPDNSIKFIDQDGKEPIDPRTGKPFYIDLSRAAVFDPLFSRTFIKKVKDNDLHSNANPWIKRERAQPDGIWEEGSYHIHESVWENTSESASRALKPLTGREGGSDLGAPNDAMWRSVAEQGSYVFIDDSYS